jgi:hypothetical protein
MSEQRSKLTEHKEFDSAAEIDNVRASVAGTPAPGTDPDSRQRLAKTLASQDIDLPSGLSTDPVTEEDREAHVAKGDKERDRLVKEAAQQRKAAAQSDDNSGSSQHAAPQGRTATPPGKSKASE